MLSESTIVKIPHCWKSNVAAHLLLITLYDVVLSSFFKQDTLSAAKYWFTQEDLSKHD